MKTQISFFWVLKTRTPARVRYWTRMLPFHLSSSLRASTTLAHNNPFFTATTFNGTTEGGDDRCGLLHRVSLPAHVWLTGREGTGQSILFKSQQNTLSSSIASHTTRSIPPPNTSWHKPHNSSVPYLLGIIDVAPRCVCSHITQQITSIPPLSFRSSRSTNGNHEICQDYDSPAQFAARFATR